jgi:hypothetical protein
LQVWIDQSFDQYPSAEEIRDVFSILLQTNAQARILQDMFLYFYNVIRRTSHHRDYIIQTVFDCLLSRLDLFPPKYVLLLTCYVPQLQFFTERIVLHTLSVHNRYELLNSMVTINERAASFLIWAVSTNTNLTQLNNVLQLLPWLDLDVFGDDKWHCVESYTQTPEITCIIAVARKFLETYRNDRIEAVDTYLCFLPTNLRQTINSYGSRPLPKQ